MEPVSGLQNLGTRYSQLTWSRKWSNKVYMAKQDNKDYVSILVKDVPRELRTFLKQEALRSGMTLNRVCLVRMGVGHFESGSATKTEAEKKNRESSGAARGEREGGAAGPREASGSGGSSGASESLVRPPAGHLFVGMPDPAPHGMLSDKLAALRPGGAATGDDLRLNLEERQRVLAAAEAQHLLGSKGSPETARSLADHALQDTGTMIIGHDIDREKVSRIHDRIFSQGERIDDAPSGLSGTPENSEPFRSILPIPVSKEVSDAATKALRDGTSPIHIAGGKGPHLLRDRKGNTAYCGGPGLCEFCDEGVPPSGDHHAELVENIILDHYSAPVSVSIPDKWPWEDILAQEIRRDAESGADQEAKELIDKAQEILTCPDCQAAKRHAYSGCHHAGILLHRMRETPRIGNSRCRWCCDRAGDVD